MTAAALDSFRRWRPVMDGLAADIHPLRWLAAGIGADAAAKLAANPRARRLLSLRLDWLDKDAGSGGPWPDWTAWEGADAAALLSGADLERSGLRLGAAMYRRDVAKLVLGRDVAFFKESCGADAYFFALRQATLARKAASLPPDRMGESEVALTRRVIRAGRLGLAAWLGFLPGDLAFRVEMKLPPDIAGSIAETAAWPDWEREEWSGALGGIFALTFGRI